jgi:hypothetical protein
LFELGFDLLNELVLLEDEILGEVFWVLDTSFEVPMHVFELLNAEGFFLEFWTIGLL